MKALKILLVDDDVDFSQVLLASLELADHTVHHAGTVVQARQLLGAERFDVVLTDMVLPDGDGVEVLQLAQRSQGGARLIIMSGGGELLPADYCLRLGQAYGAETMLKPFSREELLRKIGDRAAAPRHPDMTRG
jgi:DNA-binding NtrC family response regulator